MIAKHSVSQAEYFSLVYHDLFDFPLTQDELEFWQVGLEKEPRHKVEKLGRLIFLNGRREIVLKRTTATAIAERKYRIAQKAAQILEKIPTIEYVGITGGLSMGNVDDKDDIDLIIVTTAKTLWITRLISLLLLRFAKVQVRRFNDKQVKDKVCLNMWLEETMLSFESRREIYTAHEVLQVKTLIDKSEVNRRLLEENRWVSEFFPYAYQSNWQKSTGWIKEGKTLWQTFITNLFKLFEPLAFIIQTFYMRNKKSREVVEKNKALLHPNNWNEFIPEVFFKRLERLAQGKDIVSEENLQIKSVD